MKKLLAPRREDSASDGAFRLSRIYAEGWNAARKMPLTDGNGFDEAGGTILNPYKTEPQRSRWAEGFAKAMDS
ncbi:MAG TPA: hypothetical protein VHD95_10085 [Rhizomicrobium sp.]|jgi:hypothetical protein|nr:hypothetical protein [Rhizomicrobium sp.]